MKLSIKLMKLRSENQACASRPDLILHALVHSYGCEDVDHFLAVLVDQNDKLEAIKNNEELFDEIIHMTNTLKKCVEER